MANKQYILILLFSILIMTDCQTCTSTYPITREACFNNIIYFDFENRAYRAGHFAMNSKGDMIIEYSYAQYRLFYGLKKNGKNYFPEETKEIEITSDTVDSSVIARYESTNSFVSLKDDTNKEKEYLMSISTSQTVLELHDFEEDIYNIKEASLVFNSENGINSYIFQILEAKIDDINYYFCVYILEENSQYNVTIKKFGLTNFDLEAIAEATPINVQIASGRRITSSIIIDFYNLIAIFYSRTNKINAYFYGYDLEYKGMSEASNYNGMYGSSYPDGLFFKACYLYDQYIALVNIYDDHYFYFKILMLNNEAESFSFTVINSIQDDSAISNIVPGITINDFVKTDSDRLIFLSYKETRYYYIYFILFDLYKNFTEIKARVYFYSFISDKVGGIKKELSAFAYNGFLILTATSISSASGNDFSILLMFGYPHGTDFEINIYPYLTDTGYYTASNNLYKMLNETVVIDNNIFSYELMDQIKLVSIPDEILFFNGANDSPLSNNDNIDINYILKQNDAVIKENKYYYLDYQFLVKESEYSLFYDEYPYKIIGSEANLSEYFTPKILGGRTNTLQFKLCHNYCKTCRTFGSSEVEQKCETCLDSHSYYNLDQWNNNCIPEGYFFDVENNSIEQCTPDNSKFYINVENNKKICFKDSDECPSEYPYYNTTSKECKNYTEPIAILTTQLEQETEKETNIYSSQDSTSYESPKFTSRNEEIMKIIDKELLKNYTINESLEIPGDNSTWFQLTTTLNELVRYNNKDSNDNGLSIIILGNCETLLKVAYEINENASLIIKKYERLEIPAERNVQYEVYHPVTKQKLNLSICEEQNENVTIYIPIEIEEKTLELYKDLQKSGYDLFNIDDPFYNDICCPFKSEDGTDVLLSDRKNDYYNNTYSTCQSNCQYSSFDSKYKFLKCECKAIVDDIDIKNFDKFSKKVYKNFYGVLKNSNYKTMKCYKLVFNAKYLKKNIGSFIMIGFFICYLSLLIIYLIKGITPIQEEVIKTIHTKFKDTKIDNIEDIIINNNVKSNINEKQNTNEFPPKKENIDMTNNILLIKKTFQKKRKSVKKRKKSKAINANLKRLTLDKPLISENKNVIIESRKDNLANQEINKIDIKPSSKNAINVNIEEINSNIDNNDNDNNLDELDLNNLTYEKALESDKRKFIQIYWSKLRRKHLIIFTFFSRNDYNLIYIKIARFIFLICTSMAMSVIFFFDSSMHKIYLDYGKYNFIQQIPQILYSSIISLIIDILVSFLGYTDINIYEVRQLKEVSTERLVKIIKKIKIKLIIFFVVTFVFLLFYWYLISSFCAVYNNTQTIYIKDFITSFCLGLLYPFIIQLCFTFIRIFSLKENSGFRSLLYKIC